MSSAPALSIPPPGAAAFGPVRAPWRTWAARGGLAIALIFTALVYYPITANFFFEDDFFHLYQIANQPHLQFLLNNHAGHLYPTRNAIFLAFWHLFGTDERFYYGAAFLTHLINVGALFAVARLLTGSVVLACFGATLWGISPLGEGALGWYSVYGQVISGLAVLALVYDAARCAMADRRPTRRRRLLWYGLALVAATSFGTGLGIAMALPFALAVLFGKPHFGRLARALLRVPLWPLLVVVPALYVVVDRLWMLASGQARSTAMFDFATGLLSGITAGLAHLLGYATAQLVAGPLYAASAYPDGAATAIAVVLLAAALPVILSGRGSRGRLPALLAILLVANYASIAVGRLVLLEALGGSFAASARYHYGGSMLLTLLLCAVLARWAEWLRWPARLSGPLLAVWLAITAAVYVRTPLAIDHHDTARRETVEVLSALRAEIDRRPAGEDVNVYNRPFRSISMSGPAEFPGWAGVFVIYYPENVVDGRAVRFLTVYPALLEVAQFGRRSATLFIDARQDQAGD